MTVDANLLTGLSIGFGTGVGLTTLVGLALAYFSRKGDKGKYERR